MKKLALMAVAVMFGAYMFNSVADAQGKHRSRLDNCVRKCDGSYQSCRSSAKKNSAGKCSEKRRACRTACAKAHGR